MSGGNVRPQFAPVLEADFRRLVGQMLRRLGAVHRDDVLAYHAGCTPKTISNARQEHTSLSAGSLLNLLQLDASALDELLAVRGLKVVPVEADPADTHVQVLAGTCGLASTLSTAMADGKIDHQEKREIANEARRLHARLGSLVAEYDAGRLN